MKMAQQENLLQSFMSRNCMSIKGEEQDKGEEVELSLGLSLNGRFGVDPRAKKLSRVYSIPDFINPSRENGYSFLVPMTGSNGSSGSNLVRACSLPADTEEWRKRKEMQTLRRMEVKRKRSEKQRNLKALKDRNHKGLGGEDSCEEEGCLPPALVPPPLSQASVESQGSGSSGSSVISESESQPSVQGTNKSTDAKDPACMHSLPNCQQKLSAISGPIHVEKSASTAGAATEGNGFNKSVMSSNGAKEIVRNVLEDMPCVFTKGDGPNGKKVEGFLYRYRKGEEVRIVCVCHGSFLSPAEFVKHAGGSDVAHPLKHIVVNPSPLF